MSDGQLSFPPDGAVLREVRRKVRELAAGLGAQPAVCDNLALVVDELVNNAIEHGESYRRGSAELRVAIRGRGDALTIDFFDPEMPADQVVELAAVLAETAGGMMTTNILVVRSKRSIGSAIDTIKRHKMVYAILNEHITSGAIHALTIKAHTAAEWAAKNPSAE